MMIMMISDTTVFCAHVQILRCSFTLVIYASHLIYPIYLVTFLLTALIVLSITRSCLTFAIVIDLIVCVLWKLLNWIRIKNDFRLVPDWRQSKRKTPRLLAVYFLNYYIYICMYMYCRCVDTSILFSSIIFFLEHEYFLYDLHLKITIKKVFLNIISVTLNRVRKFDRLYTRFVCDKTFRKKKFVLHHVFMYVYAVIFLTLSILARVAFRFRKAFIYFIYLFSSKFSLQVSDTTKEMEKNESWSLRRLEVFVTTQSLY